jgi:hypothetical protein
MQKLARDHIQTEAELIIMRRDSNKKVVWYLNSEEGEFYDLKNDPMRLIICGLKQITKKNAILS